MQFVWRHKIRTHTGLIEPHAGILANNADTAFFTGSLLVTKIRCRQ